MKTLATSLLQELLSQQRKSVNHYFDTLDLTKVESIFEACFQCTGLIVLTGVGKSGIIAEKIAMTLLSTGTRALFLPPTNLLHGDIGMIGSEDLVMMLSKSGDSKELIELLPHLRRKGARVISVVSDEGSRLERGADLSVLLPVEKELCPYDVAPTTSTAAQLLFGDLLGVALMKEKGFTLENYAQNHPSGALGRKVTLTVAELMKKGKELPLCKAEDRLFDGIVELSAKQCGCLIAVTKEGALDGVFTDGDLRRALQEEGPSAMEKTIGEWMTRSPIVVKPESLALEALHTMQGKRFVTVAPVVEKGCVIGLIRMHDIIHEGK